MCCSVLQCVAVCYSVFKKSHCNSVPISITLLHILYSYTYMLCAHTLTYTRLLLLHVILFHSLQHSASVFITHCNTLQHTATHCNTLQHTATHCNTLQHATAHCNTLQHTAQHGICTDTYIAMGWLRLVGSLEL